MRKPDSLSKSCFLHGGTRDIGGSGRQFGAVKLHYFLFSLILFNCS